MSATYALLQQAVAPGANLMCCIQMTASAVPIGLQRAAVHSLASQPLKGSGAYSLLLPLLLFGFQLVNENPSTNALCGAGAAPAAL